MQKASLDLNAPSATPRIQSAADVMRLLYESSSSLETAQGDLSAMPWAERQRLADMLEQAGHPISEEDRKRIERGQADEIKILLRRLRVHVSEEHARSQATATRAQDAVGESLTKTPDLGSPQKRIPENTSVRITVDASSAQVDAAPIATASTTTLWPTEPCTDTNLLTQARRELLTMTTLAPGTSASPNAKGQGVPHADQTALGEANPNAPTVTTGRSLQRAHQAILGESIAIPRLVQGFPAAGHSGSASRVPLLQFAPDILRYALESLGIYTLADFLTRGLLPETRLLMAKMLGLPADMLLVTLYRAELLDLPLHSARAIPHPKDLLVLSRLGIATVTDLARLSQVFDARPELLTLLAKLIAAIQRADSDYVGRQSITRQELKQWAQAAAKRGTSLSAPRDNFKGAYDDDSLALEDARQGVMAWHLTNRYSDDDSLLDTVLYNSVAWLRDRCADTDELTREVAANGSRELKRALDEEEDKTDNRIETSRRQAERRRAALEQATRDEERWRTAVHTIDEEHLAYRERSWSLWREIAPRLGPREQNINKHVGFWIMPRLASPDIDGRSPPPGSRPMYVCIDPDSGAIEPIT